MPRKRLTKQQIAEGLDQVPVTEILLGNSRAHGIKLTPKQKKFAEEVAKGATKAGAYRAAYDSQAKPCHQSLEGQRLAKHPAIAQQIEAIQLALEAEKYATPLHLRRLVIQRLTEKALDPNVNDAQQLRALELLGKVTEIAAFTERRETVHVTDPAQLREKLLASLRLAVTADATDAAYTDADDLLAELAPVAKATDPDAGDDAYTLAPNDHDADQGDATPTQIQPSETPPPATPQILSDTGGGYTHSNPHVQSSPPSVSVTNVTDASVTNVTDGGRG